MLKNKSPNIHQLEINYLNYYSPSLVSFATNQIESSSTFQQFFQQTEQTITIKIKSNHNSNIRCFYYILLNLIYSAKLSQKSTVIETKFKQFAYEQQNPLDTFDPSEIESKYVQYYDDKLLKKVLVEFLHVLSYHQETSKIISSLRKYPIMDFIFVLMIRTYLKKKKFIAKYNQPIETDHLINLFAQQFNIRIQKFSRNTYFFNSSKFIFTEGVVESLVTQNHQNFHHFIPKSSKKQIEKKVDSTAFRDNLKTLQIIKVQSTEETTSGQDTPMFKTSQKNYEYKKRLTFGALENSTNSGQNLQNQQQDKKRQDQKSNQILDDKGICKLEQSSSGIISDQQDNQIEMFNFYDGMTSDEIMKILSPKIVNSVREKKEKSAEQYNKTKQLETSQKKRCSILTQFSTQNSSNKCENHKSNCSSKIYESLEILKKQVVKIDNKIEILLNQNISSLNKIASSKNGLNISGSLVNLQNSKLKTTQSFIFDEKQSSGKNSEYKINWANQIFKQRKLSQSVITENKAFQIYSSNKMTES